MKAFFLLLLILPLYSTAQVTIYDDEKFLEFTLQFPKDSTSNEIDWSRENLVSEFTLKGGTSLRYSIALKNDSIAAISKYNDGKWEFQENIVYTGWAVNRVDDNKIISEFKIIDFDSDGDEDLMCWIDTSAHGNEWTIIFLNDQKNKKLIKLQNDADESDIFDTPEYNTLRGTINCTSNGSAYGASEESTYKLNNITAIPLVKHRQERYSEDKIEDFYYKGKKGKWELIKHTKEIE